MASASRLRLAVLATHPIQYQAPLFRELARRPGVDLEVLFCHDHGVRPSFDRGFGATIQYDVPLLDGFEHRFLRNLAPKPGLTPNGLLNPEIVSILGDGPHDALVVHGWWFLTARLALLAPRGRRRLLLRGETNALQPVTPGKRIAKRIALGALFRSVDQFIAIGEANARFYREQGVADERVTLAPYSVDNGYFASRSSAARADRDAARRTLGLPPSVPLFLSSAKLIALKRPLDLLRAFAKVRATRPCALAFVGDGPLRGDVESEIERLGLRTDVTLLGFRNQSELPAIYAAADALVLPSDEEPWGLVVNEALASGTAVVASDRVGAGLDLLEPEAIFPAGDIAALARILDEVARNAAFVERLRSRGQARLARWGISDTADGFIAAAERAVARR